MLDYILNDLLYISLLNGHIGDEYGLSSQSVS